MKTKLRNTWVSKLMALCLAVVMMLSMSMTVFAVQSTDTADFEVTGFDTNPAPSVSAYRIITVNVDDTSEQPEYPMYTWVDEVADWVARNYSAYISQSLGTNAVTDAFADASAADMTTFLEEMTAAIKGNTTKGTITGITPTTVTASNGTALFEDMPMGEYLIIANGGVKIYQPTTVKVIPVYDEETQSWKVGGAEIGDKGVMKSQEPSIGKEVADGDDTVAVGDTVAYKLTVVIPDYPADSTAAKLEVGDTFSAGLTYNNDVKVYSDADMNTEISAAGVYTNVTDEGILGNRDFLLQFSKDYILAHGGQTIYVGYTGTVNNDAFSETDALGNKAFLGYNNDPYDATSSTPDKEIEEKVYSYIINLEKVDKNGSNLSGAEFTLTKSNEQNAMKFTGANGVYTYDSKGQGTVTNLAVNGEGVLSIRGLDEGTYVLQEIKAPNDYVLPNGKITIEIYDRQNGSADGAIDKGEAAIVNTDGTAELYGGVEVNGNTVSFNVQNTSSDDAGFQLPTTGGMGTMIFTIAGILLMGGAVALIVVAVRKKRG